MATKWNKIKNLLINLVLKFDDIMIHPVPLVSESDWHTNIYPNLMQLSINLKINNDCVKTKCGLIN